MWLLLGFFCFFEKRARECIMWAFFCCFVLPQLFVYVFWLFGYYFSHLIARIWSGRRHWSMCISYTAYQTVEFNCTTGYYSVLIWHCSLICVFFFRDEMLWDWILFLWHVWHARQVSSYKWTLLLRKQTHFHLMLLPGSFTECNWFSVVKYSVEEKFCGWTWTKSKMLFD